MTEIIKIDHLTKIYARSPDFKKKSHLPALDDISLSIRTGERVGLIGSNGSGKSTFIKMLSGILYPTKGNVCVNNLEPFKFREKLCKNLGVTFGHCSKAIHHMTVMENFTYLSKVYNIDKSAFSNTLNYIVDRFQIKDRLNTPFSKLSLGYSMKCEIALSLLHEPEILFLDEPTIGLDVIAKKQFRSVLKEVASDKNKTIILTSHDLDDIEDICERIIILNKGKVIYDGSLERLKQDYTQYKRIRLNCENFPKDWCYKGCLVSECQNNEVIVSVDYKTTNLNEVVKDLIQSVSFMDISIENETLESIVEKFYINEN